MKIADFIKSRKTDEDNQICGNCGRVLDENDKYCKVCGARRGEGEYKADILHNFAAVYGPPCAIKHKCENCGYKWTEHTLGPIANHQYCPECGGNRLNDSAARGEGWNIGK